MEGPVSRVTLDPTQAPSPGSTCSSGVDNSVGPTPGPSARTNESHKLLKWRSVNFRDFCLLFPSFPCVGQGRPFPPVRVGGPRVSSEGGACTVLERDAETASDSVRVGTHPVTGSKTGPPSPLFPRRIWCVLGSPQLGRYLPLGRSWGVWGSLRQVRGH